MKVFVGLVCLNGPKVRLSRPRVVPNGQVYLKAILKKNKKSLSLS